MWSINGVIADKRTTLSRSAIRGRIASLKIEPAKRYRGASGKFSYYYADEDFDRVFTNWESSKPVGAQRGETRANGRAQYMPFSPKKGPLLPQLVTAWRIAEAIHASRTEVSAAIETLKLPSVLLPGGTNGKTAVLHYPSRWIKEIRAQVELTRKNGVSITFTRRTKRISD